MEVGSCINLSESSVYPLPTIAVFFFETLFCGFPQDVNKHLAKTTTYPFLHPHDAYIAPPLTTTFHGQKENMANYILVIHNVLDIMKTLKGILVSRHVQISLSI